MGEFTDEIEIMGKLFRRAKTIHVPFGFMRLSLFLKDEKPVLRVGLTTRMDMDMIYLFDGENVRTHNLFGLDRAEKRKGLKA